jgi:hypothetical protein
MKKTVLLSAIILGSLAYNAAQAQISVNIGFNLPVRRVVVAPPPPPPQPVEVVYDDVYDDSDDYYYLPEVEAYWSISLNRYFFNDGGRWVSAAYLPGAYRNFDWRSARRFEVRGRRPYFNHDVYRSRWGGNPNRGNWNRGPVYAGRGNDNRYNGGWGQPSRGGYNEPSRGAYNQPNRNYDRGNWGGGQPQRGNNGSYSQPNRNDDNRGGWGGNQGQPSRGNDNQNGGRGGWGGGQGQPSRGNDSQNGGSRDRGMQGGGQIAQNQHRGGAFGGRY